MPWWRHANSICLKYSLTDSVCRAPYVRTLGNLMATARPRPKRPDQYATWPLRQAVAETGTTLPIANVDHFVAMRLEIQHTSRSRSLVMIGLLKDVA